MTFFLVSITLPSSATAMVSPDSSQATPIVTVAEIPQAVVATYTTDSNAATAQVNINAFSGDSQAKWQTWQDDQVKIAAKQAAAAAKKEATKKAAAKAAAIVAIPANTKQTYAFTYMADAYGWTGSDQQTCLMNLWNRESGWNTTAANTSSGAYGIPQALPGTKMATVGSDWKTNYKTQIKWGLQYINGSYGSPCAAWAHSNSSNWY